MEADLAMPSVGTPGPKVERKAPMSATTSTFRPRKRPESSKPSVASVTWARAWVSERKLSPRLATQRTGRFSRHAAQATAACSG